MVTAGASMRPEDFSPGNSSPNTANRPDRHRRFNEAGGFLPRKLPEESSWYQVTASSGFNEAGGFLPRKHLADDPRHGAQNVASMRPEDFSPGN